MSIAEKLQTVAENQQKVYDAGYAAGQATGGDTDAAYNDGYTDGHTAGKQAEYDRFWADYQQNGERTNYTRAFGSECWTDETFKPKFDISLILAAQMFQTSKITNLKALLETAGVSIQSGNSTMYLQFAQSSAITHFPALDLRKATNTSYAFGSYSAVISIEKLIVSESTVWSYTFDTAYNLEEIRFEGTIGKTGLSFAHSSKLSLESAKSILLALKDFTGTGEEYSCLITLHADTWTLLDADGNTAPDGNTWKLYTQSKGWNI